MKRIVASFIILCSIFANAQEPVSMGKFEAQLVNLFEEVYEAPTDNERYHANEAVVQLFANVLTYEESVKWRWNFGTRVSVLTSSDNKFRIFTWPVRRDNGEIECFGFVQAYDEKEEEWVVTELHDKSEDIINVEQSTLDANQWFGTVYQELITLKYEGQNFYVLLGGASVDLLVQRKVMEPISFKRGGGVPQFGLPVFRRDPTRRRMVMAYTTTAMANLRYEEQFTHEVEKKRVKQGGKTVVQEINHDEKRQMIIFDQLEPQVQGMEGLFQYYVPSGAEMAYIFREGKWELHDNAQGRLENKKLNKDFVPLPKSKPEYAF